MSGDRMRSEMLEQPGVLRRLTAAELARERGAPVGVMSDAPDADLPLPDGLPEPLAAFPATARAQQLALALADARGIGADEPAGLTKVTPTQ
jgi:fructoselysine-6-P-deglycase FrlB-like protein